MPPRAIEIDTIYPPWVSPDRISQLICTTLLNILPKVSTHKARFRCFEEGPIPGDVSFETAASLGQCMVWCIIVWDLQVRGKSPTQPEETSGAELTTNKIDVLSHGRHLIDGLSVRSDDRLDCGGSYFTLDAANRARTFDVPVSCEDHVTRDERLEWPANVIHARDCGRVARRQAELRKDLGVGKLFSRWTWDWHEVGPT